MRNLGVFLPIVLTVDELKQLGLSLGGTPIGEPTLRFGEVPEAAFLDLATDLANGCFDDEEFQLLQNQLGFAPRAYVSIHMSSTPTAMANAVTIARSIQDNWGGNIDYSGAGGTIDDPVSPPISPSYRTLE